MAELDSRDSSKEINAGAALAAAPVRAGAMPLILVVAGAFVAAAIYAHLSIASNLTDYTGLLAPLDRLFDLLLVAFIAAISFCAGRAVCRLIGVNYSNLAEEAAFCIGTGTGVIGLAVFGLGLIGLLSLVPVAAVLILLIAWSRKDVRAMISFAQRLRQKIRGDKQSQVVAGLILLLALLLAVRTATPPHAVDESIYHLSVTRLFVEQGRIYPTLDSFSGNMPFLIHMIYAVCLLAKADIAAKLYSLLLAFVWSLALYGFCARFLSRRIGLLAMFGFFGAGIVVEVGVTARNDLTLAGMLFLALYAMFVYLEGKKTGWLLLSAITSGFSLGIKYSAAIGVGLIGVMLISETLLLKREPIANAVGRMFLFAVVALAVASPWYIKNYVWLGNPVYPYVTGEVAEIKNGRARFFDDGDQEKVNRYMATAQVAIPQYAEAIAGHLADKAQERVQRHPFRFWEHFLYPELYVLGNDAEGYHDPNYLFLIFPVLFLFRRDRRLVRLGIYSAVFFVAVAATSWIARYYLPLYPPLTILSAAAFVEMADRLRKQSPRAAFLPSVLVTVAVVSAVFVSTLQVYKAGSLSFIAGRLSRGEFLSAVAYYHPIDFINRQLPADARIMLIGAQMCYQLQRPYLAEAGWDSVEWRRALIRNSTIEELHEDLKARGITHILFSPSLFEFVAVMGREGSGPSGVQFNQKGRDELPDYQVQLETWTTLELYRAKFLDSVFTYEQWELLKLR